MKANFNKPINTMKIIEKGHVRFIKKSTVEKKQSKLIIDTPEKYEMIVGCAIELINYRYPSFNKELIAMKAKYGKKLNVNDYHDCLTLGRILHEKGGRIDKLCSLAYGVQYVRPEGNASGITCKSNVTHDNIKEALLHSFLYRFYQAIITAFGIIKLGFGSFNAGFATHLNNGILAGKAISRYMKDFPRELLDDVELANNFMMKMMACSYGAQEYFKENKKSILSYYDDINIAPMMACIMVNKVVRCTDMSERKIVDLFGYA